MLAIFSRPTESTALGLRRERYELARLIRRLAAGRRGYITTEHDCAGWGSTLVTILAGPLNYIGVNPTVERPGLPQPSE